METELPHGDGEDHPEGIALLADGADARLLVVHDSPSARRRPTPESVLVDRVRIGTPRPLVAPNVTSDSPTVTARPVAVTIPLSSAADH
jgi:hypothetical protein